MSDRTVNAVVRERRKDRDSVVSSVYPGRAYALTVAMSDPGSTILCGCTMNCDRAVEVRRRRLD